MESKLQFGNKANVVTADGRPLGRIDRVVLHPESKSVSHIVVRGGSLFKKQERVVPVELIAATDEKWIVLREDAGDVNSLPPFEQKRLVGQDREAPRGPEPVLPAANVYGAPLAGLPAQPPAASGEEFVKRLEQNIPEGTVAMKEGAKVIASDGKAVGSVERVVADAPADRATHLVVSLGNLNRDKKLVPMERVSLIDEDEVHLLVEADSLKELAAE